MKNRFGYGNIFLLLAILLLPLSAHCDLGDWFFGDETDKLVAATDRAIQALQQESADWRKVLQETRDKMTGAAQSTIRNEIDNVLSRAIAASGAEFRCNYDFIRKRVIYDLTRIKMQLLKQPVPAKEPALCSLVPLSVDASWVPSRLNTLTFYGYDFDTTPIQVLLQDGNRYLDVSQHLDKPTHYHMTLNLGANGVSLSQNSKRFVLKWNSQEISSVGIIQPPPPPPPPKEPEGFIVNMLSGKCIDVHGEPGVRNGDKLMLWDCEFGISNTDQKWKITSDGFIQNNYGRCIDVHGTPGVHNGAQLMLWDCEFGVSNTDQRWRWKLE